MKIGEGQKGCLKGVGQDEGKRLCFLGSGEVNGMECDGRTSEILSLHPSSKYELQR